MDPERLLAQREWVRALALRLVGDPGVADDLSQDSLVAALEKPPRSVRSGDERTLRAWLASVVRNLALKRSRAESNRRARESENAPRGPERSAEDVVQEAALHRRVVDAVMELEPTYRTPVLLRYFDGRDIDAIAAELDLAPAAVRKRLSRGVEKLRARFDTESGGDRDAWMSALGPLALPHAAAIPSPLGIIAMSTFAKVATVAAAVVIGIAVWPRDGEAPDVAGGAPVAAGTTPAVDDASTDEADGVVEASPTIEEPAPDGRAVVAEPAAAEVPRLLVRVVAEGTGAPVPGAKVMVFEPDRSAGAVVDGSVGVIHQSLTADADGLVTIEVPVAVELRGSVRGRDVERGDETFDVAPFADGEVREVVVELSAGVVLAYYGRLLDRETGEPVVGAEIRTSGDEWGRFSTDDWDRATDWSPRGDVVATTDAGGNFGLEWRSWKRTSARVHAEGYGATLVEATDAGDDPESPELVYVSRAAELRGRVVGPTDDGLAAVVVGVTGSTLTLVDRGRAYQGVEDYRWHATTGEDGSFSLAGLPPSVDLRLHLRQDGTELMPELPVVRFEPGEVREETYRVGVGHQVTGRVVGPDGEPVADRYVALATAVFEGDETYFRSYPEPAHQVRTDDEGRFVFFDVAVGEWWIGPPYVRPGRSSQGPEFPPYARRITVPTSAEVIVEAQLPLYIEGRVVDPRGDGVARAQVSGRGVELRHVFVDTDADESGRFRIGPLAGGEFELSLPPIGHGEYASVEAVRARAGTKGVVIPVVDAGSFRATFVDAETGAPLAAVWSLTADPPLIFDSRSGRAVVECRRSGLLPGTYHVVGKSADGRVGVLRSIEVRAGVELDDLRVELAAGGKLVVRNTGKAKGVKLFLLQDGVKVGWLRLEGQESKDILLPPGETSLVRYADSREILGEVATADVGAGEEREVVLTVDDG